MRKKYRRRRRFYHGPIKKKHKIIIFIILLILLFLYVFYQINAVITPILMTHAETEVRNLSLFIINDAVTDDIIDQTEVDELYVTTKSQNTIQSVDFNTFKVNQLLRDLNENVWERLTSLQEGNLERLNIEDSFFHNYNQDNLKKGVIYEIPFGVVFKHSLLSNLGPKIPVKLSFSGNMNSYLKTNVKNYGINNVMIEISIQIDVEERILLPFHSKKIAVSSEIPLAIKIIEGQVPNYYSTGLKENSPIISATK